MITTFARTVTSLSFLYALTIAVLLLYGWMYYKTFTKSNYQRRRFPYVFLLISVACFSFLYFNIHASLSLKTFSNLDHYFIRHDGYQVKDHIELGRSDTASNSGTAFNSFVLQGENGELKVSSKYSEEPFYASASGGSFKLLSNVSPAINHHVSFLTDTINAEILTISDTTFKLTVNAYPSLQVAKKIKKGASAWSIFKDDPSFINTPFYTNESLINSLKSILILRDNVLKNGGGEFQYFISTKLFKYVSGAKKDGQEIIPPGLAFTASIRDNSTIAWGIGFLDNNRNQFRVKNLGTDSFSLLNRYPVSYPLAEAKKQGWSRTTINKFLVSDTKDMLQMPWVFSEGFLFPSVNTDNSVDFSPILLSYEKRGGNEPVQLKARSMYEAGKILIPNNNQFLLPAKTPNFNWIFSVRNTFEWDFGSRTMSPQQWQLLIFGSLFFFFLLIFFTAWLKPADQLSWIWQLLSCVTIVLLTTRFFLYWRYKSFPPYEGMDLPSQQQLQSIWNFGIIVLATVLLALIFGYGSLRYLYQLIRKNAGSVLQRPYRGANTANNFSETKFTQAFERIPFVKKIGSRNIFFISWLALLGVCLGIAFLQHFDPSSCRHLAIGLMIAYFFFVFVSYNYSPLVKSEEKSWWKINTGRSWDLLISNPVKVLLSFSLLAAFVFIDIGFAIVFLNFLLFNEAFLCINYAIAGLSAGSRNNARVFGIAGTVYLLGFIVNLLYAPYIFKALLDLPQWLYLAGYILFAVIFAYIVTRLLVTFSRRKKILSGIAIGCLLFAVAFLFFPKEKILDKAAVTKYRIDVMTMPADKAIETAYEDGKTFEPVIRAAQNQWFINAFIYEKNNPGVNSPGFQLLPHAPQNKGAKYNAQATDLVASRFFIAEHGKWSVLFYVLLLLLPATLLASFYKLYPDFTNRININYPTITAGFSLLNYLLITALLVILAATGRYIFFGQDLPFGSILSKQSILFPSLLIITAVALFRKIPLEHYPNRKKFIPGTIVFAGLALLLFFVKPVFNKDKEFTVEGIAKEMDDFIQVRLQPVLDYFDSSRTTKRLSLSRKDQLFTDSVRKLLSVSPIPGNYSFFAHEITAYTRAGFLQHLDQTHLLYLNLNSGSPQLSVNDNYFRIDPPPHLQQSWTGNVFGDSSIYNLSVWDPADGSTFTSRFNNDVSVKSITPINDQLAIMSSPDLENAGHSSLYLINRSLAALTIKYENFTRTLLTKDSFLLSNPTRLTISDTARKEFLLTVAPDAYMKNFYVNGSRFYVYPMGNNFTWARNFAESISSDYTHAGQFTKNAFVSFNYEIMDSLAARIRKIPGADTAYKKGAEYGICIADGNGRLVAMTDFIKGIERADPNDRAAFNRMILGENGLVSQSLLRKQAGNLNLLRLNPGPGSTLKPVVFTAIASQLDIDWDQFGSEGFSVPQHYYGGEKVAEYDFEKDNGKITKVIDYLRYSDNYYHSNVLLLGSYPKQSAKDLLEKQFVSNNPEANFHWPFFSYKNKQYWLDNFQHWPGYTNGKATFGSDSSFVSIGLFNNYGIYTADADKAFDKFSTPYDSSLFMNAARKSGFILPEYALFDQQGTGIDHRIPYDLFTTSFRGHVKGSSQVRIPPVKMLDAYGKMISQNKDYSLTLNPYATEAVFNPFYVDQSIPYNNYLSLIRESVFAGMREALFRGTAARLGSMLKDGSPYFYYAKTGTTGDNDSKTKSKLFAIIISQKDVTAPGFNFRKNKFYTIYFTSQNGPAKQNEEFQAEVIKYVEQTQTFLNYMNSK